MRMTMMMVAVLSFAAVAMAQTPPAGQVPAAPPAPVLTVKAGDVAPAFSLPGSDGRTHTLAEFAGKKAVILAWYPKAFTGG